MRSETLKRMGIFITRPYESKIKVYIQNPRRNQNRASWGISLCTASTSERLRNADQIISLKGPLPVPSRGLVSVSVGIS